MEDFSQINVFAWICTAFAHLIMVDIRKVVTYAMRYYVVKQLWSLYIAEFVVISLYAVLYMQT